MKTRGNQADLASSSNGSTILFATDDFFAVAENLISPKDPIWLADKYTEFGKWMDGWETRRKRIVGHDWAIIKIGCPGFIQEIQIDTAFFTGNHTPKVEILAATLDEEDLVFPDRVSAMGSAASPNDVLKATAAVSKHSWGVLLPKTTLNPGVEETRHHSFAVSTKRPVTHVRINMYPDGGIARLRLLGTVAPPDWGSVDPNALIDLAALQNGGTIISFTDAHYGSPAKLIAPSESLGMWDGWETKRTTGRPEELTEDVNGFVGSYAKQEAVLRLGHAGVIRKVVVDTKHFKGNFPESFELLGRVPGKRKLDNEEDWVPVVRRTRLQADSILEFAAEAGVGPTEEIKFTIYPDGGVSRLRVLGNVSHPRA
ncbi:allantoicase-like protein [Cladochytrium replicatum]|nr:allantoicase-like protein [Cladochytrium replicatum]